VPRLNAEGAIGHRGLIFCHAPNSNVLTVNGDPIGPGISVTTPSNNGGNFR